MMTTNRGQNVKSDIVSESKESLTGRNTHDNRSDYSRLGRPLFGVQFWTSCGPHTHLEDHRPTASGPDSLQLCGHKV